MSSAYQRTSRVVDFAALHALVQTEAQRVATKQSVGDLTVGARLCVETHSRHSPGFFARLGLGDPDPEHWTAIILTRDAVLAGRISDKRGTHIFLLPLSTLVLDDSIPDAAGGPVVWLSSPSLGGGQSIGSYAVYVDSTATQDTVISALRAALAERRAG